jgi:hypothetical protein
MRVELLLWTPKSADESLTFVGNDSQIKLMKEGSKKALLRLNKRNQEFEQVKLLITLRKLAFGGFDDRLGKGRRN